MTDPRPVLIPTKDRKQAMDWSLALTSQGIEVSIVQTGEERFALEVPAAESTRAFRTLKLYHQENQLWGWWRNPVYEGPRFEPAALVWVMFLVFWYGLSARAGGVLEAGMMNSGRFLQGEWWRLFTAVTLHHDLAHLAANCSIGVVLFGLAGARYGLGVSLLASYLAGVGGNVAGWMIYTGPYTSLGASGMVMGALGLLISRPGATRAMPALARRALVIAASAGIMLFLLLGANPQSDLAAHAGGFVSGLFLGWFIRRAEGSWKTGAAQRNAGGAFILLLLLNWWLALR